MKIRIAFPLLFALLCATLSAVPAMAGTIYDNGGPNGSFAGWNFARTVVSDTVVCAGAGGCTPTDLTIWIVGDLGHPLPTISSFVWSFTTAENSGTGLGSGIANASTGLIEGSCSKTVPAVCSVFTNLVPLTPFVHLPAGVSWLNLSAADTDDRWSQNNGMSKASTIILGKSVDIPSEAFNVSGTTVPEPSSILLLGTGILGFAGVLRRKLKL